MPIRLATFNVENLYARFDFSGRVNRESRIVGAYAVAEKSDYEQVRMAFEAVASDDMRQITALALADTRADLVCLQEVDSQQALDVFYRYYLYPVMRQTFARAAKTWDATQRQARDQDFFYDHRFVISGNDTRGIDVGVMANRPLTLRSHAALTFDFLHDAPIDWEALAARGVTREQRVLRRDCVAVDVDVDGAPLTVFNCHLKSMSANRPHGDARADLQAMRLAEVWAVRKIIEQRFPDPAAANWVVCGDFNDFCEVDGVASRHSALGPFFADDFAVDPMRRRASEDRWTHYYVEGDAHVQLDYILLSPRLAAANPDVVPDILRKGMPYRVPRLEGADRYPRVGWARPKASDHCPVAMTLHVPK